MPKLDKLPKDQNKLSKGQKVELGEIFGRAAKAISPAMEQVIIQIIDIFHNATEEYSDVKKVLLSDICDFLENNPDLAINGKLIKQVLKIQRDEFRREIHHIEDDYIKDDKGMSLGEQKLGEYGIKAFSSYFRDDLIRRFYNVFLDRYPDIKGDKITEVPPSTQKVIYDILRDSPLTMFLVMLKERGLISISDNLINTYEVEEEVKLININKKDIIKRLQEKANKDDAELKCVFKWTVEDIYYDYPDSERTLVESWEVKSTFRIRKRSHEDGRVEYFYTIKRKLSPDEEKFFIDKWTLEPQDIKTRRCHEKELKIEVNDLGSFKQAILDFGLVETRGWPIPKKRESYTLSSIPGLKFDFDNYEGHQDMLELEAEKNSIIADVLKDKDLGLGDTERMVCWKTKYLNNEKTKK